MGIIVDIIIVGIVALSTFLAYKKGMIELTISFCAFIISIVATFLLYQPISNLIINTTNIDETIEKTIYEKANDKMIQEAGEGKELTNQIMETTKNEMLPQTARSMAISIVKVCVSLFLWIAIKIALRFINVLADAIAKLPIIKQLNQTGGILFGVVRGILIIYVTLLIIGMVKPIWPENIISQNIEQSSLGKAMYENNVLSVFFVKN